MSGDDSLEVCLPVYQRFRLARIGGKRTHKTVSTEQTVDPDWPFETVSRIDNPAYKTVETIKEWLGADSRFSLHMPVMQVGRRCGMSTSKSKGMKSKDITVVSH